MEDLEDLACPDENCKEKYSLKGIEIPMEDIQAGKIHVKEILKEKMEAKRGKTTDIRTESGAVMLLKFGRFGSYLKVKIMQMIIYRASSI